VRKGRLSPRVGSRLINLLDSERARRMPIFRRRMSIAVLQSGERAMQELKLPPRFVMIKAEVQRMEVDQGPNLPRRWRRLPCSRGSSRP
jgi:hypothetical protein